LRNKKIIQASYKEIIIAITPRTFPITRYYPINFIATSASYDFSIRSNQETVAFLDVSINVIHSAGMIKSKLYCLSLSLLPIHYLRIKTLRLWSRGEPASQFKVWCSQFNRTRYGEEDHSYRLSRPGHTLLTSRLRAVMSLPFTTIMALHNLDTTRIYIRGSPSDLGHFISCSYGSANFYVVFQLSIFSVNIVFQVNDSLKQEAW